MILLSNTNCCWLRSTFPSTVPLGMGFACWSARGIACPSPDWICCYLSGRSAYSSAYSPVESNNSIHYTMSILEKKVEKETIKYRLSTCCVYHIVCIQCSKWTESFLLPLCVHYFRVMLSFLSQILAHHRTQPCTHLQVLICSVISETWIYWTYCSATVIMYMHCLKNIFLSS